MRRATSIVALSLMLILMVGTAVSAKGQGGTAAVTFSAQGGTGPAGGTLPLTATVHNATAGSAFSAVALVHFATGDVSLSFGSGASSSSLRTAKDHAEHGGRHHHHKPPRHPRHPRHPRPHPPAPTPGVELTATTQVPIAGEEAWGTVTIDVTFSYAGQVVTVHTTGLVDGYPD